MLEGKAVKSNRQRGRAGQKLQRRPIGFWEAAIARGGNITLAAWAMDAENQTAPSSFVFRWNDLAIPLRELVERPDVASARGEPLLACGLKAKLNLPAEHYPLANKFAQPSLCAVWDDGTEYPLKPLNSKSDDQFFWKQLGLPDPHAQAPQAPSPMAADAADVAAQPEPASPEAAPHAGTWEQAVFTPKGVTIAAWALRAQTRAAPRAFEFRWGGKITRVTALASRPDVERGIGAPIPPCGALVEIPFTLDDIPDTAHETLPAFVAIWDDGTEWPIRMSTEAAAIQFRFLGFRTRPEFTQHFQNPAFRIRNTAVIAWASRRALGLFGDDADFFMSALCVLVYRHLESGFFTAQDIVALSEDWKRREATLPKPYKGERLRWVISVKLALAYFYMVQGDTLIASDNFRDISQLDEHLATWPQASTNLLIGVFMAAWFEYREGDLSSAIARLGKAYTIFKNGVTFLPIWSKHHFSELENSLRIAGECFGLQKLLEGETREHILPASSKPTFIKISLVLRDLIARGQIEDGPFPERGQPPTTM